ncbi:hypothetical protein Trydic_g9559 [Trypoxylus dichotomus]
MPDKNVQHLQDQSRNDTPSGLHRLAIISELHYGMRERERALRKFPSVIPESNWQHFWKSIGHVIVVGV